MTDGLVIRYLRKASYLIFTSGVHVNIDVSAEPLFFAYTVLLVLTGVGTMVFAVTGMRSEAVITRAVGGVVGLAMFGYGLYLAFVYTGTDYQILWQVFFAPFVLLAVVVKGIADRREAVLDGPADYARQPAGQVAAAPGPQH